MRLSESFFYTIRENVKDEETLSGNLLVRSGMVKKVSNGIYMYMPLGLKVLKNIEKVIRKHMNENAVELLMPNILPEDVYINSGRRTNFGNDMFSLKDRYNRSLVLGPTHEEFFVEAARMKIKSYKDMPFNIYQIGNKYRDEPRPRFGLIRVREFFMKDAYSFDKDLDGLDKSYQIMYNTYNKIFTEIGLDYRIVKADTGVMGGLLSEEFQAVTTIGEDILVLCDCGYSSNIEVSECVVTKQKEEKAKQAELVFTPNCKSITEVCDFLDVKENKLVKTLIYKVDNDYYACLVAGDREINEIKLRKLLKATDVSLASLEEVLKIVGCEAGYVGPIGLKIKIIIDEDVLYKYNYVVGANKSEHHLININTSDYEYNYVGDIKEVKEHDKCPLCNKNLYFKNGIEIGNTFKLGNKYSKTMDLKFLNEKNELEAVEMGCYGIGLGRILAAYVEQNHDENGILFNNVLAPYLVNIIVIDKKDDKQVAVANALYNQLNKKYECLLDDREERAGVKFNDSDLIGIPYRITIGKKVKDDIIELKVRETNQVFDVHVNDIVAKITEILKTTKF